MCHEHNHEHYCEAENIACSVYRAQIFAERHVSQNQYGKEDYRYNRIGQKDAVIYKHQYKENVLYAAHGFVGKRPPAENFILLFAAVCNPFLNKPQRAEVAAEKFPKEDAAHSNEPYCHNLQGTGIIKGSTGECKVEECTEGTQLQGVPQSVGNGTFHKHLLPYKSTNFLYLRHEIFRQP